MLEKGIDWGMRPTLWGAPTRWMSNLLKPLNGMKKSPVEITLQRRARELARLMALSGELDKAREMLQQMRNAMPHHAESLFLAEGEILQELKLYEEVVTHCGDALAQHPGSESLLYLRAFERCFNKPAGYCGAGSEEYPAKKS